MTLPLADAATEQEVRKLAADTTLGELITAALTAHPDVLLTDDRESVTYAELLRRARAAVPAAAARPDALVLLESRNDVGFVVELLATLLAGRVPVLAMPGALRPEHVAHIGSDMLPAGTAFLLTSGGTTGRPKLIPRRHDEYQLNVWLCARNAQLRADDVLLVPIPAAHNYALGCPGFLGAMIHGAAVVLTEARRLDELVPLIERHRVSVLPLVPAQARTNLPREPLSGVRLVQVGGAPVAADDVRTLRRVLGAQVQTSFGMAEGLLCQSAPEDDDALREAGTGRMLSEDDEYRIVDPDATGAGQLEVRGPYTISGYVDAPEVNASRFTADGWFRTGDHASPVGGRRFLVHGRADDVINRGGELIDPTAVETLVRSHPGVVDAAAVGQPHPVYGEIIVAFVVLDRPEPPESVLLGLMRDHGDLPTIPDRVVVVPDLPLTTVGKVDRKALAATVRQGRTHR